MMETPVPAPGESDAGTRRPTAPSRRWEDADDEELLKWRICDLKVSIEGSVLEQRIARLHQEMADRGLCLHPPCYLATEWLCPDGVPAIGIPFCLAHPRLQRLEKTMMLEVEGDNEEECVSLLRHEAGHTMNYAYQLHKRTRWRELFGPMSADYDPHEYYMRPYSRQFVVHLSDNYAQAHPDEDFAETFAVWLTPGHDWRQRYRNWPALKKLLYVERLMKEIGSKPPLVTGGPRRWAAARTRSTLGSYYRQKRREFAAAYPGFYDNTLKALFTTTPGPGEERAYRFLRRYRRRLVDLVARWARVPKFTVDHMIKRLAGRAREIELFVPAADTDLLMSIGISLASIVLEARERYLRTPRGSRHK